MTSNCIFCGKAETSKEHAFPEWLMNRYRAPGSLEHQRSLHAVPRIKKRVDCLRITVECVCMKCNNEWMSGLQARAIPVITRLLDCPTCTLDTHDCKTLALWAVMSTMVLETFNEAETWRFTDLERCLFHKCEQIPPFTRVWTAKWIASPGPFYESHNQATEKSSDRGTVTTFAFGNLAFQVLKVVPHNPKMSSFFVATWPGLPWDQIMLQVWEPQVVPICWPPLMAIHGEADFDELALRFSPPSAVYA